VGISEDNVHSVRSVENAPMPAVMPETSAEQRVLGGAAARERGDAAHTLKGAARAVGAWRLAALADEFETALTAEQPETLGALLARLERAMRETQAAVALSRAA
jgi:HPt (histidine-containing phosphotransfer) domain-containing protein